MSKHLHLIILLALVAAFLVACGGEASQPAPAAPPSTADAQPTAAPTVALAPTEGLAAVETPRLEPLDACFAEPPEDLPFDLNANIDCGYVILPEFHAQPGDRTLKVGYTRLNARQETGAAPLFMLGGGPGQDMMTKDIFLYFAPQELGSILDTRDVVILNQRGVKHTEPFLDCPAYHALDWTAVEQGTSSETLLGETLRSCVDELESQGVNFDAFNSVEIAADVNAAREALGYDQIVYYGASYGAQLGQHVIRDFPDMLESVVLDGVNSLSRRSWIEDRALDAQWGLDNLIALCEADQACREAYDIQALVDGGFALFDDAPLTYTYTDPEDPAITFDVDITKADLANLINSQFGSSTFVVGIPFLLTQYASDRETLTEVLGTEAGKHAVASRNATEGTLATLMHYAVVCSDDPVGSVEDLIVDETVGEFARHLGESFAREYATACEALEVQPLPDTTDVDVTADIPTLILAGDLDTRTPSYRSQIVADALLNDTFVVLSGRTHVQIDGANACAGDLMTQFVTDPGSVLDTSCVAEDPYRGFILPDGTMSVDVSEQAQPVTPPIDLASLVVANGEGWMWLSHTDANGALVEPENPTLYTLIFDETGSLFAGADCNFVAPTYQLEGERLSIDIDLNNLGECAEGSLSRQYLELLTLTESAAIVDGRLQLTLREGAGSLVFAPNDPAIAFRVETWEEAADKFLAQCDAPGAVFLVDSPDDRILRAYGLADAEAGTPMQSGDRFEIGSNTKSFTTVLALQLQEEGVWSLDDPLALWLPDEAARIPNGEQMTLRQLASNTSGVWDYANPLIGVAIDGSGDLEQAYTPEELIDYVVDNGKPSFAPGEGAQYSSTNFILLGQALEAATGESLASLYQTRIFDPLGMTDTSLLAGIPAEGEIVSGYYTQPNGEVLNTTRQNGSQMWAAGGIISTAEDMARYVEGLAAGSVFKDEDSLAQMTTFGDKPISPFLSYGLGVGKWSEDPFNWGHAGQTAGFQTWFGIFPEHDTRVILLTNSASCSVSTFVQIANASPALFGD